MIQITRKAMLPIPATLQMTGLPLTQQMAIDYDNGVRTFNFNNKIYGAKDVKGTLIDIQNYKCAFCEARIGHIDDGDVEHFRPKKGFIQIEGDKLTRPGYYWLAYDWDNLFWLVQSVIKETKEICFLYLTLQLEQYHIIMM